MGLTVEEVVKRHPGSQTYRPGDSEQLNRAILELMRSGRKEKFAAGETA